MAGLNITLDDSDFQRFKAMQKQLPELVYDEKLKKNIGTLLAATGKTNIDEGRYDTDKPYTALAQKTKDRKGFDSVLIGAKKLNVKSGVLRNSLSYKLGSKDTIYLTAMDYAKYHQFEDRGKSTAPYRPIFSLRKEDVQDVMRFITNAFKRLVRK